MFVYLFCRFEIYEQLNDYRNRNCRVSEWPPLAVESFRVLLSCETFLRQKNMGWHLKLPSYQGSDKILFIHWFKSIDLILWSEFCANHPKGRSGWPRGDNFARRSGRGVNAQRSAAGADSQQPEPGPGCCGAAPHTNTSSVSDQTEARSGPPSALTQSRNFVPNQTRFSLTLHGVRPQHH